MLLDLNLNGVEFSTLPSGLHQVEEDVVQVFSVFEALFAIQLMLYIGTLLKRCIMGSQCSDGDLRQRFVCQF